MVERDEASPKLGIPNPGRSGNRILGPAPAASNNRNQGKRLGTKPGALQVRHVPSFVLWLFLLVVLVIRCGGRATIPAFFAVVLLFVRGEDVPVV